MDFKKIKKIIKLMEEKGLSEFEWEEEGVRIRLKRGMELATTFSPAPAASSEDKFSIVPDSFKSGVKNIVSPMVGTFYRAGAPDASPLVEKGQQVQKESVVCVIEAMKVMNEIASDVAGEIIEILARDGQPVEFGQPLFKVRISP
jgi:acetyl-CoA carboxylase biotin carboxyl carrier protein